MIRLIAFILFILLPGFAAADRSVLSEVNTLRADAGQGALTYSTHLEALAQTHADDMSAESFFSHTGSDGSQLGDRARRVGYGFCFVAENIAKGQRLGYRALQGSGRYHPLGDRLESDSRWLVKTGSCPPVWDSTGFQVGGPRPPIRDRRQTRRHCGF